MRCAAQAMHPYVKQTLRVTQASERPHEAGTAALHSMR